MSEKIKLTDRDINGRPAQPPLGFSGVVGTLIATGLAFFIYYMAGAFNQLF